MLRNFTRPVRAAIAVPARSPVSARPMMSQLLSVRYFSEQTPKKEESNASSSEPAADSASTTSAEAEAPATEEAPHPLQKLLEECQAKLDEKDKQLVGFKDKYHRSIADFQNLQTRTAKEVADAKSYALRKFAKDLLESVDNFDRALSVVEADKKQDPVTANSKEMVDLYDGIKLTQNVFEKTLEKHGITKLNPIGEKFDPNLHEALFQAPQEGKEPGTVLAVQQTGFLYNGKVLRAAKVGVVLDP